MGHVAKIFMNGRSQAVRLPAEYRFESNQVYVRRDPTTGDVVLSRRPGDWADFFESLEHLEIPEDFMVGRKDAPPQRRKLLA